MPDKPTYEQLEKRIERLEREAVSYKRTKEALKKYDLIFSSVQDPMAYIDKDYLYRAVNDTYLRIFRKTREEIVGHSIADLLGKQVFDRQIKKHIDRCLEGEEVNIEDWFNYPTWGTRYAIITYYPFVEDDGTVSGVAIIARDITKRKKTEEKLNKTTQALIIRNKIDQILLKTSDQEMYTKILNIMIEGTISRYGTFEYIDQGGGISYISISTKGSSLISIPQKGTEISDNQWEALCSLALTDKKMHYTNTPIKAGEEGLVIAKSIVVPIVYQDTVIGTIVLANKEKNYIENDRRFLEPIVKHIAPIIHARMQRNREENERKQAEEALKRAHDELERIVRMRTSELLETNEMLKTEIEERKRMEAALRQSEEMFRAQYRGIPVPTFTWKKSQDDFLLVDYNKATEDFTRGLISKFVGKSAGELYGDRPDIIQDIHLCYERKSFIRREISYRMFTTDENKYLALTCAFVPTDMVMVHMEDITEKKMAEEKMKRSEKNLRILSSQLLNAKEDERKRISQELHDSVGQYLTSIKFHTENTLSQMEKKSSKAGLKALKDTIPIIQTTIDEVRRISMDLRPSTLDDLGILATISWFCREFQLVYTNIRINKTIDIEEGDVPEHLKIIIFRTIQESLNNVAKHSQADTADITLLNRNGNIELTISDNGKGFDAQEKLMSEDYNRGLGLASMEERAELSNGIFSIDSVKGLGTLVMTTWRI
ncbi:MAG: PAS domain-containing protein [Deltaproteobacteria bacterium]|nr:PAS domain-containing protein [Deltaproteobacteria bacterium]